MEIDVTHMVWCADEMIELAGSQMEHGPNAGPVTWNNSKEYGRDNPLLTTDDMREAARKHFSEYGAWSEEELQAITCQDVAASIREMDAYDTYEEYSEADGRIYKGDNGRWYFYMGS